MYSLGKCLFKSSAHFLMAYLFIYLFIFAIQLHELFVYFGAILSIALFANIFSHSVGCLFILFMISFAVKRLLISIKSYFLKTQGHLDT